MDKSEIILAELERLIYEPFQQNNQVSEKIGKVIAKSYDLLKEHTESVFRFQNDISAGYLYPYMISSNFFNGKLLESKSDFEERESVTYYYFLIAKVISHLEI